MISDVNGTAEATRNTFCRSVIIQWNFFILITWRSSSLKSAAVYKISWKSDDFSLRYSNISIFKMAAIRHLGICFTTIQAHPRSLCCWLQLPVKFHVNLVHRSKDIYLNFSAYLAWNAYSGPQNGCFGGLWTPECDYSLSRPPKGTSLHKSVSCKLSTVNNHWGVWPVGELTESVTDTQTDRHTQVNLYSVHALHSTGQTTSFSIFFWRKWSNGWV